MASADQSIDVWYIGWQPISTAPNNGKNVLVSDGNKVWISSRRKGSRLRTGDGMPTDGYDWSYSYPDEHYPTHWMALPRGSNYDPGKEAAE